MTGKPVASLYFNLAHFALLFSSSSVCSAGRLRGEVNQKPQKHLQTSHQARARLPAVAERRKLSEDEEEKGNQEKVLMTDTKSGRAQVRRVKKHLKSKAMSRAKMPVRSINPRRRR